MAEGLIFATPPAPPSQTSEQRVAELEIQLEHAHLANSHLSALVEALEVEIVSTRQLVALLLRDPVLEEVFTTTVEELQSAGSLDWSSDEDGRFRISLTSGAAGTGAKVAG